MAITISFPCPVGKLLVLQQIVKSTGGRFDAHLGTQTLVRGAMKTVFVQLEMETEEYQRFTEAWDRATTPITEKMTPRWRQLVRRYFKWK